MSRGKKLQVIENVTIIDLGAEGKAVAKVNEKVLFVTNTVPGDIVDVQLTRKRRSYMEGFPIKFHHYSDKRVVPFCEHFGICGGCKWQNLPYNTQLEHKQKLVADVLKHLGKFDIPKLSPILASKETQYYRNKLEFTFSNKRWLTNDEISSSAEFKEMDALGFHIPKMFDKVLDIKECYLQGGPSNAIRLAMKQLAIKSNLGFFDLKKQEGFFRNLIIRTSSVGEVMVIVSFFTDNRVEREKILNMLAAEFPSITSLMYVVNPKQNDNFSDLEVMLYKGRDHIFEEMEGLKFKIGPKSFYQTNSNQAYQLYKVARDFAAPDNSQVIYDLYTGTGTIANFIARSAKKVIGIEYVPESIKDAKENSEINGITNTSFFSGDMKDIFTTPFIMANGIPDTVIIDPPRAGMHKNVINALLEILPKKIVYVSCNPSTQARDINMLSEKYRVISIQPVDMFPHTHHVENVILLEKNLP